MLKLNFLKNEKEKPRNPNIDFIKILGMLAIIIHHLLLHGKAMIKYKNHTELQLLNILCKWHVSSFGIISGMVGKKIYKFSKLFYLWIITLFYLLLFYNIYNKSHYHFNNTTLISNIFPVIHKKYWYFSAYFGIYPFLPFIIQGSSILPRILMKKIVYFMIGIFIIWASYYGDIFDKSSGYSPFSLLIFYIFGSYINKYIFYHNKITQFKIAIYLLCSILFISSSFISYYINIKNIFPKLDQKIKNVFRARTKSLIALLQVFSLTILVSYINFNKFFSKIITFIGPLIFDVYLIHENPNIRNIYIKTYFTKCPSNLKLHTIYFLIFKGSIYIFVVCISIAYIRNIIFKYLFIKIISIKSELLFTKIINYFI